MMRWHNSVRRKLGAVAHGVRGFRGHVDGIVDNAIVGWVAANTPDQNPLTVGIYTAHGLLTQGVANIHRGDIEAAGIGNGQHGFVIPLSDTVRASIAKSGNTVKVKVVGPSQFLVGKYRFPDNDTSAKGAPKSNTPDSDPLAQMLYGDLTALEALLKQVETAPPSLEKPKLARHGALFSNVDYINGGTLPAPMTAYQDYARYRYCYDKSFDFSDPDEARHFMRFYTAFYGPIRGGLRIPLPKEAIDRFNTLIQIDGHRFEMTHITWSYLIEHDHLRQTMNLADPNWCFSLAYWWSIHQSKALHAEDCLVPDHYIALLRRVAEHWEGKTFPMTRFMEQYHAENTFLHRFDVQTEEGRRNMTLALLIKAVQRPDFLRYLPEDSVEALLQGDRPALADFAHDQSEGQTRRFDRTGYAMALRIQGFDLETHRFLNFTPEGHRMEAAMLPPVTQGETVDIQMIGPFQKASGLGQATRLSAAILDHTDYTVNAVDFGLDNPAPEGFSRVGALSDYKRARVNLIHLNGESIPLAFAYQPDVFSDAYNIGYFYWELDSPAACHYLGLELLDEVWVSTEYGVEIYQPATDKPVTNVGMCFEDLPEIPRQDARDFVCDRFRFKGNEFVFLVAFDSFSFIQRKNPIGTLKAFREAFDGVDDVRLVIKTQNRRKVADPAQVKIWNEVDALIKGDKRVRIMDETLSYDDLLKLKKGCDCYVSLHKSEGWGFGMIEAMNLEVPVVCTGYSGNMDFCRADHAWLVGYDEIELTQDDYIFVRDGQKWAEPRHAEAVAQLYAVYADPAERESRTRAAWQFVQDKFSVQAIARRYDARLAEIFKTL